MQPIDLMQFFYLFCSAFVGVATLLLWLRRILKLQAKIVLGLFPLFMFTFLIPIFGENNLQAAELIRGVTGELSVSTLIFLFVALFMPSFQTHDKRLFLVFIALGALFLYPLSLGLGAFDPYRLGFGNIGLIIFFALIGVIAHFKNAVLVPLAISLAFLAFALQMDESTNFWDYLIDPLIAIYAIVALIKNGVQKRLVNKTAGL